MSSVGAAKIAVVYYTTYGHIGTLAKSIVKGIQSTGASVDVFQVPETLPKEVLEKMHAPAKDESVPVITDSNKLAEYDGILFGTPTQRTVNIFSHVYFLSVSISLFVSSCSPN